MGWSTTVVSQPDGDMGIYMASLEKLIGRDESVYWPTHGPAIEDPASYVPHLLEHRREREAHVVQCIEEGRTTIEEMVEVMYQNLDPRLTGGARRSVQSHLIYLIEQGRVECGGEPSLEAVYGLVR
jgi:glyoxylase-like metal-dependent hydrolase (beta-lactamase superfamily II)